MAFRSASTGSSAVAEANAEAAVPDLTSVAVARRLVVNADDFGRSASVNAAVARAHREGILTSASLMVNEAGFEEALEIARANERLGVGLHLTLIQGHSTLPREEVPGLVDGQGAFGHSPVGLGFKYFFLPALRDQLYREISAQVRKFHATGLRMDHLNGHLHLHMQPVIFRLLMENAGKWGITHFRLTCEPLGANLRAAKGRYLTRCLHALIFRCLAERQRAGLRRAGLRHTGAVFGQLQDGRVNEDYVLRLLPKLRPGDSELYLHPSLDKFKHEFEALVSPRVRDLRTRLGIRLIRYQDL